ncbi:acetoacetyl-CoA reductase [Parvularcula dongshanensis]|uniref:Acetoacetyl-CoA reductase n=1 Tax=Parvularcula dongshanensis TaxID=1173995 RepID=A0A840HYZ7_9PROT|nr:acetoacetyl-CoA reductase [Parvularcula dongshanensis]MBB4657799.1 acetoacetyl-CoA reductase [Parvularcula dongshanensis]
MSGVAIVTGGTRGIGKAISARLKGDGYTVAAIYGGNDEAAKACADELGIAVYRCDVSDPEGCAETVSRIEAEHGPVAVLVNNAGITRDGMFHKMSADQWRAVLSTNLDSAFNMTRPVIDGMRERGFGRIVSISSINGQKGQLGQVNYSAAKAGLIGFTRALAMETARKGITVNAIAPGYVETDMTSQMKPEVLQSIVAGIPVGRMGKPEEIAHAVSYLVSEHAGFVTGAVLTANGGQYVAA